MVYQARVDDKMGFYSKRYQGPFLQDQTFCGGYVEAASALVKQMEEDSKPSLNHFLVPLTWHKEGRRSSYS